MNPIVNTSEIKNNKSIVLVDASSFKAYQEQHLTGALYVDLETQLSNIGSNAALGGRHPLPSVGDFCKILEILGITKESHVVVYDRSGGANAAARFWWMLRAVGHEKVQVLNGGFQTAVEEGFPISSGVEVAASKGSYTASDWQLPRINMDAVEKAALDTNSLVIDVRAAERYEGITEPIDLIAGHIPGAINIPLSENLDANGLFKTPESLRSLYQEQLGNISTENVTVHCGSGVTACHTLLAFDAAGLGIPNLYVGSWSEWSRNDKLMVTQ